MELTKNLILRSLRKETLDRVAAHLRVVDFRVGETVFETEEPTDIVFPLNSVVSLLRQFEDGTTVEISMVGAEGMAGVNAIANVPASPFLGIAQSEGKAARLTAEVFRDQLCRDERAQDLLLKYLHVHGTHAAQLAACNRLHVVPERLAHWLLKLHDRVGRPEIPVSQEFLSRMLGTRRAAINEAVRDLTESGAIEHRRNSVTIKDRRLLEEQSCGCYEAMVTEYQRSMGFPARIG